MVGIEVDVDGLGVSGPTLISRSSAGCQWKSDSSAFIKSDASNSSSSSRS